MEQCPDCNSSFESRKALGAHYSQSHDGPMPKPDSVDLPDDKDWEELSTKQRSYYRHREERMEKENNRRRERREWFNNFKETLECEICGEDRTEALDFHHKNAEEKDYRLGVMPQLGFSKERIMEEVDKCKVLCANCHRVMHADS